MTCSALQQITANDHTPIRGSLFDSLPPTKDVLTASTNSPRCHREELTDSSSPAHAKQATTASRTAIRLPRLVAGGPQQQRLQELRQQPGIRQDESARIRSRYLHRLGHSQPGRAKGDPGAAGHHPWLRRGSGSTGSLQSFSSVSSQLSTAPWPVDGVPALGSAGPAASSAKPPPILKRPEPSSSTTAVGGCSSSNNNNRKQCHRHVSFPPMGQRRTAQVRFIPPRWDYPEDVQNALWMRGDEYDLVVARNTVEFLAEGCDVDSVLEEEDFVPYRGRLVHPAHFMDS